MGSIQGSSLAPQIVDNFIGRDSIRGRGEPIGPIDYLRGPLSRDDR